MYLNHGRGHLGEHGSITRRHDVDKTVYTLPIPIDLYTYKKWRHCLAARRDRTTRPRSYNQ